MALPYGEGGGLTVRLAGPFSGGGGASDRIVSVNLPLDKWKGGESPYFQVVDISVVSLRSQVNLQLSVEQTEQALIDGTAFTTENNDGEITVYAIGQKPTTDYTIQATVSEVIA